MVTQQLECPVCFIRFDTGRRPGRSVACPYDEGHNPLSVHAFLPSQGEDAAQRFMSIMADDASVKAEERRPRAAAGLDLDRDAHAVLVQDVVGPPGEVVFI